MYYTMVKYLTERFPPLLTSLFFYRMPLNLRNIRSQLYNEWSAARISRESCIA